ncbi:MAG: hypothetical protein LAT78_14970 [Roseinatronobacter sp.]|nr:hypothetical protein [Roseinatronobacter sp.]
MTRILICTPDHLRWGANALMSVLGAGPEDGSTFDTLGFSHKTGAYAVAAFWTEDNWLSRLTAPLSPPDWAVDLHAAERAQSALKILEASQEDISPDPETILVILGASGRGILERLGLSTTDID